MIRQKRFTREIQKSKYESVIIFPIYSREYQNIFIQRPDPPQMYNNPQYLLILVSKRSIISDMANIRSEIVARIYEYTAYIV